jgi:hypothetical protein
VLFAEYNWSYQVEEDEVDETCGTNGGEEDRMWVIGGETRRKDPAREDQNVDRWITLRWIL